MFDKCLQIILCVHIIFTHIYVQALLRCICDSLGYLNIHPNELLLITLHGLPTVIFSHPSPSLQHACRKEPSQKTQPSEFLSIKFSSPQSLICNTYGDLCKSDPLLELQFLFFSYCGGDGGGGGLGFLEVFFCENGIKEQQ